MTKSFVPPFTSAFAWSMGQRLLLALLPVSLILLAVLLAVN